MLTELPNLHALARCAVHPVTGLDVERSLKDIVVNQRNERSRCARRMRIGEQLLSQRRVAILRAPYLRVPEEEPLIAGKSADDGCFLSIERDAVRAVRSSESAQVSDVLSHRELGIDVDVIYGNDGGVLSAERGCARIERGCVGCGPPVAKVAES